MNDPRVTDYALGELDPAAREAFERDLATSTALQQELQETIALLETLPTAITMNETLTDPARKTLRESAADNFQARRHHRAVRRYVISGAIAASLAVGVTIFVVTDSRTVTFKKESASVAAPAPTSKDLSAPAMAPSTPAIADAGSSEAKKSAEQGLLVEGEQFAASGRYDLAVKRYEQVLQKDRYNIPARRGLEKVAQARDDQSQSHNQTRSELLASASTGWELPVSKESPADESQRNLAARAKVVELEGATFGTRPTRPAPAQKPVELAAASPGVVGQGLAGGIASRETSTDQERSATTPFLKTANFDVPAAKSEATAQIPASSMRHPDVVLNSLPKQTSDDDFNTEAYDSIKANAFLDAQGNPLSTFSIDVDTASYANVRRFLNDGQLPPAGAVRLEELINYFPYSYPQPEGDVPFSVTTDVTRAPWNEEHLLARIALKGREVATDKLPASNLVFLIDVSGSMDEPDKLPLLKRSLSALVEKLSSRDHVAIVVYAGASGLALPSTSGEEKARILEAIDRLQPGGSTNGASGIRLAYDTAREHFLKEGNNRVILCTDGDFNVGVTNRSDLVDLIEGERKSGVFLSVLGFGTGNVKDSQMEQLADKGNGNYAYIDTPAEGRKVLVEQMGATLFTIAKDVKIQVEFNPATVAGYRLIGYENRLLAKEDFNDDKKDAGEIGAGHTVTALYEIVPAGQNLPQSVDPLKYQTAEKPVATVAIRNESDLFTVKLRYKAPDRDQSKLLEKVVKTDSAVKFDQAPTDFRFASAVAAFGMKLRADQTDSDLDWNAIQKIARESLGEDPSAYRAEFLTLIQKARQVVPEETQSKDAE